MSSTATTTVGGPLIVGGNTLFGGAPYLGGFTASPEQMRITQSVNDLTNQLVIANTSPGPLAAGGITFANAGSTDVGISSIDYAYLGFSGPNFAAFTGLPPNSIVLDVTDGSLVFGATSANTASSTMAWAIGTGYAAANYDMVLKNVGASGPDTASGGLGLGTTTPYARLSLSASSTATFPYIAVDKTTNGAVVGTILKLDNNGNFGLGGTTTPGTLISLGTTGANTVNISNTSTSTFGQGINIKTGCFAVNGNCVGGSGGGGSTIVGGYAIVATSTSMSFDFCGATYATSTTMHASMASSNYTWTWTNDSACKGKWLYVEIDSPMTGLIGSTTWAGTSSNIRWAGQINPGTNLVNGMVDRYKFTLTATSTTFMSANLENSF